ncbi:hypothetical protein K492DRAFT_190818 [Lichtheimia hyalospora FSU 10163]|nr:hypothetical protein K492DRAFT_190818 [Lichtheimia hyalospora FSU 10163]
MSDRPLDTIFDRLPSVFVPSYAATLGHLTDVAHSYDDLEHQDYVDEQYTRIPEDYIYQFKQLQHQPWRFFYLDLDRLSREIQSLHQFMLLHDNTCIIDQQQTSFIRTLDAELAKVNDFYTLKLGEIQRRVAFCYAQPETKKGRLEIEINHTLPNEIALLAHFSKSNYRALFAVLARYDSQVLSLQRPRQPVLQNQLYRLVSSKLFYRPADLLELMSSLNKLHKAMRSVHISLPTQDSLLSLPGMASPDDELRQVPNFTSIYISPTSETAELNNTSYLPPSPAMSSDDEERSTSGDSCVTGSTDGEQRLHQTNGMISVQQFWVHPDNLVEIMLHIGKYLDIQDTTLPQAQTDTVITNNSHYTHGITTLHLDTPQLTSYTERAVASDNGKSNATSTALRIRWYDQEQHTTSNKPVVALEEKVYCSTNTHVSSGKRRGATRKGHKSLGKSPYRPSSSDSNSQAGSFKDGTSSLRKSKRYIGSKSYFKHRLWFKSKHMDSWLAGDWSLRHVLSKPECKHWHLTKKSTTAAADNDETTEQVLAMEENARACHMEPGKSMAIISFVWMHYT